MVYVPKFGTPKDIATRLLSELGRTKGDDHGYHDETGWKICVGELVILCREVLKHSNPDSDLHEDLSGTSSESD